MGKRTTSEVSLSLLGLKGAFDNWSGTSLLSKVRLEGVGGGGAIDRPTSVAFLPFGAQLEVIWGGGRGAIGRSTSAVSFLVFREQRGGSWGGGRVAALVVSPPVFVARLGGSWGGGACN